MALRTTKLAASEHCHTTAAASPETSTRAPVRVATFPARETGKVSLCQNQLGGYLVFALGKLGGGGTKDELAKPLIAVQRVQLPPDQSRADRSVVSVAIHRATGGCEAYTARK